MAAEENLVIYIENGSRINCEIGSFGSCIRAVVTNFQNLLFKLKAMIRRRYGSVIGKVRKTCLKYEKF